PPTYHCGKNSDGVAGGVFFAFVSFKFFFSTTGAEAVVGFSSELLGLSAAISDNESIAKEIPVADFLKVFIADPSMN
ncbi:MAG TPA: hypothetical protein DCZ12_01430, partial [Gammaproteobacteria bacterium]|nr:hypothetical protein [Gammaproteobacteria bacterium]